MRVGSFLTASQRRLAALLYRLSLNLPRSRLGDAIISVARFYHFHQRLPLRRNSFNDTLCRMQLSGELDHFLRVFTSDKEFVKFFQAGIVGLEHVVDTIAVIHDEEQLRRFEFPERCCIKATAGSGEVMIVEDGIVDRDELAGWLQRTQYDATRERNYKPLKPKIIVEPLIFDDPAVDNIKCFLVNGKVRLIQSDEDRFTDMKRRFYDTQWNDVPGTVGGPAAKNPRHRPGNIDAMIRAAELVGSHFGFVRIDMYTNDEHFFMGEITHNHGASLQKFFPPESERSLSQFLFADSEPRD